MRIKIIVVGKTDESYLKIGIQKFIDRLVHYVKMEMIIISDLKLGKLNSIQQNEFEGKEILKKVAKSDYVVLLDDLSDFLQEYMSVPIQKWLYRN